MSSVEQLSATWNALVFRSTTKKEDLPAILANLLDLSAYQILSQEPRKGTTEADKRLEGNAMRAILWSLEEIPLSLLYNAGPRVRANEPHKNRWIPLAPAETTISAEPTFKVNEDGFSVYSHAADRAKHKTQLCFVRTPTGNGDELVVDVQTNSRYRIKFLRASGDTFEPNHFEGTCFLFENPVTSSYGKGACLRVSAQCPNPNTSSNPHAGQIDTIVNEDSGQTDDSTPGSVSTETDREADVVRFQTIYDCPIRVYMDANPPSSDDNVETVAGKLIDSWCINIEYGKRTSFLASTFPLSIGNWPLTKTWQDASTWNGRCPRRPLQVSPMKFSGMLILVAPFLILSNLLLLAMRIVIAVQDFRTGVTALGVLSLISLVIHLYPLIPWPFNGIFMFISIPLFITDEVQRAGMSSLDTGFIALCIIALLAPALIVVLWGSVFPVFAYRAWLATFEKGWDPNQSYRWIWELSKLNQYIATKIGLGR